MGRPADAVPRHRCAATRPWRCRCWFARWRPVAGPVSAGRARRWGAPAAGRAAYRRCGPRARRRVLRGRGGEPQPFPPLADRVARPVGPNRCRCHRAWRDRSCSAPPPAAGPAPSVPARNADGCASWWHPPPPRSHPAAVRRRCGRRWHRGSRLHRGSVGSGCRCRADRSVQRCGHRAGRGGRLCVPR